MIVTPLPSLAETKVENKVYQAGEAVCDQITTTYLGVCAALVCALFLFMGIVVAFLSAPIPVYARTDCGTWQQVPHPFSSVGAIIAKASDDVWVRASNDPITATTQVNLFARWDGTDWNVVTSMTTTIGSDYQEYGGGSVIFGQDDIWVAATSSSGPFHWGWARHWDGMLWTEYTLPSQGFLSVNQIAGAAPNNLWVVGYDYAGPYSNVRVDHWNGTQWNMVSKKIFTKTMSLLDVKVLSNNKVWIVGNRKKGTSTKTLIMRRDKQGWEIIPSPNPNPSTSSILRSIDFLSPKEAWAVGESGTYPNFSSLVLRWNGKKWKTVSTPNFGIVAKVGVALHNDVWVHNYSQIFHWDGSQWSLTYQVPNSEHDIISDLSVLSSGEAWATMNTDLEHGVILHYASGLPPCAIPLSTLR